MGKNKEVTVGYRYFLGQHAVLCQSPIDSLLEIQFGDRTAWTGRANNQQISVFASSLFGGKAREGGVSGYIDVEGGAQTQDQNDYLATALDGLVPNFRGVFALVFRKFYFGNNPYIKPWKAKVQNIFSTFENWIPELAPINTEFTFDRTAIYIAIDNSTSMLTGTRLATQRDGVKGFLNALPFNEKIAVKVVRYSNIVDASDETFGYDATGRAAMRTIVDNTLANGGGTDWEAAVSEANQFFIDADAAIPTDDGEADDFEGAVTGGGTTGGSSAPDGLKRIIILVSDGVPARTPSNPDSEKQTIVDDTNTLLAAISPGAEVFGINIDLEDTQWMAQVDSDGAVPVIDDGEEDQLTTLLGASFSTSADLNPAHILRDVLISPTSDGSGDTSAIGTSFATAAQTLFNEGFGLSFFWQNPSSREAFKQDIEYHINAQTYFDRVTGKWEIKLIRDDYTVGSLFTFDRDTIVDWVAPPDTPKQYELPNQITLVYTRRDNGKSQSVTLTNNAAVVQTGRVVNEKVTMRGITWSPLANKVAQRELESRSKPLTRGEFRATYCPTDLNLGSAFIINEPRLGLNDLVCRVTEIEETDGRDNAINIKFVQDVFATNMQVDSFAEAEDPIEDNFEALPPNVRLAVETPYWYLGQLFTFPDTDAAIVRDDGYGRWMATCDKPNNNHLTAELAIQSGSSFLIAGSTSMAPTWQLLEPLNAQADDTTFTATATGRESEIAVGDLAQVDDEIIRIDSIAVSNGVATFTVGRGCLDTVPAQHGVDAYVIGWEDYVGSDFVNYTEGESVVLKILPSTRSDTYGLNDAESDTITFAARANSPYPVGKLQMDASYDPGLVGDTVTATWTHRDRTSQTTTTVEDHTAASIGPETSVVYTAVARVLSVQADFFGGSPEPADFFAYADTFIDETTYVEVEYDLSPDQVLTYDFDMTDLEGYYDADTARVDLGVKTTRGTSPQFTNWQTPFVRVEPLLAPVDLTGEVVDGGAGAGSSASASPTPASAPVSLIGVSDPVDSGVVSNGFVLEFDDSSAVFADTARTTAITDGTGVGGVTDKASDGRHAEQGTSANRMIWRSADGGYVEGATGDYLDFASGNETIPNQNALIYGVRFRRPVGADVNYCMPIGSATGSGNRSWMSTFSNRPRIGLGNVFNSTIATDVDDGYWHTLIVVFDSNDSANNVKQYLDGVLGTNYTKGGTLAELAILVGAINLNGTPSNYFVDGDIQRAFAIMDYSWVNQGDNLNDLVSDLHNYLNLGA